MHQGHKLYFRFDFLEAVEISDHLLFDTQSAVKLLCQLS